MGVEEQPDDLVSVVVPAYNAERYLAATLASALAQMHNNLEVIVVDDGSTDGTVAVVEAFMAADRRVRLIRQGNGGVAAARNRAIAESRGAYIAPLDADDLWHPEKLAAQLEVMRRSPSVGCVTTWCCSVDVQGDILWEPRDGVRWHGNVLPALILEHFAGCASSPLIRRRCMIEAQGYDQTLRERGAQGCEDYKLLLTIAERHDFAVVPRALTGYRQVPDSMSQNLWGMLRSHELVMDDVRRRHPDLPDKLFRWSRSAICAWLATRAVLAKSPVLSLQLLAQSVRSDWLYVAYLSVRFSVKWTERTVHLLRTPRPVRRRPYPEALDERQPVRRDGWMNRIFQRRRREFCLQLAHHVPRRLDRGPS